MEPTIRRARLTDAPTITAFNAAMALETENLMLDPVILAAGVRAGLEDESKARYFVAEIGGIVVGQLMLTLEWSDWRNGEIWWIQSVYVHPQARRKGIFSAIYRHVESLARESKAVGLRLYVEQHNHAGQQTYTQLGMGLTEYLVMEKMLAGRI
jgi:GNAT superfamily N-acetyltransferase